MYFVYQYGINIKTYCSMTTAKSAEIHTICCHVFKNHLFVSFTFLSYARVTLKITVNKFKLKVNLKSFK